MTEPVGAARTRAAILQVIPRPILRAPNSQDMRPEWVSGDPQPVLRTRITVAAEIPGQRDARLVGDRFEASRSSRTTAILGGLHNTTEVVPHNF
jgi:hypothetical protein